MYGPPNNNGGMKQASYGTLISFGQMRSLTTFPHMRSRRMILSTSCASHAAKATAVYQVCLRFGAPLRMDDTWWSL